MNNKDKEQNVNNFSFESALVELEGIVKKLETGNESLNTTLKLYEEGIKLFRYCNEALEKAEQKINIIQNDGEYPFTQKGD